MNLNDLKTIVKTQVDLKTYLEKEGLVFKQVSSSNSVSLCPFHSEKTPSFTVSDTFQTYRCFGCGARGDIFTYVQEKEAIDWKDSVVFIAKNNGIKFELDDDLNEHSKYNKFYEIIALLEEYFKDNFKKLNESHPAKKMITDRNLSVESFDYGYSPYNSNETLSFLYSRGVKEEDLRELKLLSEKGYFMFRNRLMFFTRNYMGKTIGFTGRALTKDDEDSRKYINSGDSLIYHKKNIIFNIDRAKYTARKEKNIYLVEGQFDVIAMTEHNYSNVVAVSGTAITQEHIMELTKSIEANGKIILVLDGDEAGFKASIKVFQNFPEIHNQLYIVKLPNKQDPCDFFMSNSVLPKEEMFIEYYYQLIRDEKLYVNTTQKNDFLNKIQLNITQYIKNKTLKEQYLRRACMFVGVKYEDLNIISTNNKNIENKKALQKEDDVTEINFNKYEMYYLAAINLYINNSKHFPVTKEIMRAKEYPSNLVEFFKLVFFKKIKEKDNVETYKDYIKALENFPNEYIEDKDLLVSQYSKLLDYASFLREQYKQQKVIQRAIIEIEKTENEEDAISVLKGLDDISK